jgi:hypothetical protein
MTSRWFSFLLPFHNRDALTNISPKRSARQLPEILLQEIAADVKLLPEANPQISTDSNRKESLQVLVDLGNSWT